MVHVSGDGWFGAHVAVMMEVKMGCEAMIEALVLSWVCGVAQPG